MPKQETETLLIFLSLLVQSYAKEHPVETSVAGGQLQHMLQPFLGSFPGSVDLR